MNFAQIIVGLLALAAGVDSNRIFEYTIDERFDTDQYAVSHNGNVIAAGGEGGSVRVWRIEDDKLKQLKTVAGDNDLIYALALDGSGNRLAAWYGSNDTIIWNTPAGHAESLLRSPNARRYSQRKAVFSYEGDALGLKYFNETDQENFDLIRVPSGLPLLRAQNREHVIKAKHPLSSPEYGSFVGKTVSPHGRFRIIEGEAKGCHRTPKSLVLYDMYHERIVATFAMRYDPMEELKEVVVTNEGDVTAVIANGSRGRILTMQSDDEDHDEL